MFLSSKYHSFSLSLSLFLLLSLSLSSICIFIVFLQRKKTNGRVRYLHSPCILLITGISLSSYTLVCDNIIQSNTNESTLRLASPSTCNESEEITHCEEHNLHEYLLQNGAIIDNIQYPFSADILLHLITLGWTQDEVLIGLSMKK
jgi:hypothetical protein